MILKIGNNRTAWVLTRMGTGREHLECGPIGVRTTPVFAEHRLVLIPGSNPPVKHYLTPLLIPVFSHYPENNPLFPPLPGPHTHTVHGLKQSFWIFTESRIGPMGLTNMFFLLRWRRLVWKFNKVSVLYDYHLTIFWHLNNLYLWNSFHITTSPMSFKKT